MLCYDTIQYNTIQYNTIQYNTIQYYISFGFLMASVHHSSFYMLVVAHFLLYHNALVTGLSSNSCKLYHLSNKVKKFMVDALT